jgi:biofilm PGA synthesis N-glycosyltransferase PgaC
VLIPCHNEGKCVQETMERMSQLDYPDYEIIAIDDGSTDNTGAVLRELAARLPRLRVVTLAANQGKAVALKMGMLVSRHEFLVCIDADAFLEPDALRWLIWHFINGPRVGAVTGNPRIRNRTTLLGKIQVGEYSTIIGMIKRSQRIAGKVFTVSGVAVAYRKRALLDVGLWSDNMVTEDIDVSWKLQQRFWDIRFEERALCWILTPESIRGLWRQRVRWAQGGAEVMIKYSRRLLGDWRHRRFWPVYLEYQVSVIWAYAFWFSFGVAILNFFVDLPEPYSMATIIPPEWAGTFLACVCIGQVSAALRFDRYVEPGLFKYVFWFIWYPFVYWVLSAAAIMWGLPRAVWRWYRPQRAVWRSPDRGLHTA